MLTGNEIVEDVGWCSVPHGEGRLFEFTKIGSVIGQSGKPGGGKLLFRGRVLHTAEVLPT